MVWGSAWKNQITKLKGKGGGITVQRESRVVDVAGRVAFFLKGDPRLWLWGVRDFNGVVDGTLRGSWSRLMS
jgi:hypothetical protein